MIKILTHWYSSMPWYRAKYPKKILEQFKTGQMNLDEALERAVARDVDQIVVVTPMMTRGGEHAEVDIPAAVRRAQVRHPSVSISYVWPFDSVEVAEFLAGQINLALH